MPVDWQQLYANRAERMTTSDIREILKLTAQPDMISLAGGLPASELFPVDEYRRAFEWIFETEPTTALQYGVSEGYMPLREFIAQRMTTAGSKVDREDVFITNGAQQGLDVVGKLFLNPGDHVVVENPSYMGAIQAFNQYEPDYTVVPMEEDGMQVDALEGLLKADRSGPRKIKFIYALPNFQNPTGRTMALDRRKKLVKLAAEYGVPIVEDDPYGELRYEGEALPSLHSLDTEGLVIYLGTFSKVLAPGFRLGWMAASQKVLGHLMYAKQPSDLHTAIGPQMATYLVARDGFLEQHIKKINVFYRERRDVLLQALDEYLGPVGATHNHPQGGLFVWTELPAGMNARTLLAEAVKEKVAFVPGQGFHADGSGQNTMRLNFSTVPPERLREGVKRLGDVISKARSAAVR
jgi:2-aminoadipate transaminase